MDAIARSLLHRLHTHIRAALASGSVTKCTTHISSSPPSLRLWMEVSTRPAPDMPASRAPMPSARSSQSTWSRPTPSSSNVTRIPHAMASVCATTLPLVLLASSIEATQNVMRTSRWNCPLPRLSLRLRETRNLRVIGGHFTWLWCLQCFYGLRQAPFSTSSVAASTKGQDPRAKVFPPPAAARARALPQPGRRGGRGAGGLGECPSGCDL